jgi:DNA-binding response OmpR family regulator
MAKILLAEDDKTMVSLLKTLLTMEGFEVLGLDVHADVPAAIRGVKNPMPYLWMYTWAGRAACKSCRKFAIIKTLSMFA